MSCHLQRTKTRLSSLRGKSWQYTSKRNSSLPVHPPNRFHLFSWYNHQLKKHPLRTKSITAGLIAGTGDIACQSMTEREWNASRTSRFVLLGSLYSAPTRHYFFDYLARAFPGVVPKVIMERVFFAPASLAVWLTSLWTLESLMDEAASSKSPFMDNSYYLEQFMATYPPLLQTSWLWWTPIMALNFRFVPVQYQVLWVNVFNLVWNTYLSYQTSRKVDEARTSEPRNRDRLHELVEVHIMSHALY
ncbi:protein Mpv17 [Fistulifera solaris]|uniref:Protein Mpv17 n=1 Tax=Fistulifera solaris TaxID=1519565 RepID=A0A1Z5JXL8_FISSO|nr:protein Mpv17 [Fistulifera solaris]|eukprot:GAX18760.1 protein Mpv17 [Fistulifera solaris]